MGVQTDVVIADLDDAQTIAATATPTADREGFTFNGFDHVQVCTLLSLLKAGRPDAEFGRYLGVVEPVAVGGEEGPVVVGIKPEQVAELAAVAGLDEAEFGTLAASWAATEEFAGWSGSDVRELLRDLGDLAESASHQGKCLMLWQSL
jgi:hypothetical protein